MSAEAQKIREFYAALNRGDIPSSLLFFDPLFERVEPAGFPTSGTYRGLADVERHFTQARNTWAEGSCEPEEVLVFGDQIVVFVHVQVRLLNQTEWIDAHIADGFTFRDGRVIQMRTFLEKQEALEWAREK